MITSPNETESHRLAMVADSRDVQLLSHAALQALDEEFSHHSSSDGFVFYGLETDVPTAAVFASTDPNNARHEKYRQENLDGRLLNLSTSALGRQIKYLKESPYLSSQFEASLLGSYRGKHMTWAPRPIMRGDKPVAIVQFAGDVTRGPLPDQDDLEKKWSGFQSNFTELGNAFHDISLQYGESLQNTLELLPPSTPNAFVVRWDIDNSTESATGPRYGALRNYSREWRQLIKDATAGYSNIALNEGDGQNVVFWLPHDVDTADPSRVSQFKTKNIDPIMLDITKRRKDIDKNYPELSVSITAQAGYIETDPDGTIDGPVFSEVAKITKPKKF